MADCHSSFKGFYEEIKLAPAKKVFLRTSRDAVRKKIKKYFKEELEEEVPKFRGQGSYSMDTIVNPLDGEYDIDDGVYLSNLDSDKSKWPSAETAHNWVFEAVKGHTDTDPVDKRTCVRVIYAGQYHVDLPIYGIHNNTIYLAEKGKTEWTLSDPKAITDWFLDQVKSKGEQLRRVVRYLKAWADNKSQKMPSGLVLTILASNNFVSNQRDDIAFTETVRNIYNQLLVSTAILNPVDITEDLSGGISKSQMNNFKDMLSKLIERADKAIKEDDEDKACELWTKEFGNRFSCNKEDKKSRNNKDVATPIIISNGAKPWAK
ncbi:MAG: hypothetical protein QME63_07215 [Actinomycetota bacterium]|nr:hypothetical protein [Actinomycetota bacterium]